MKRLTLSLFLITTFAASSVFAGDDYLYRQRANWVKLEKADPKDIPLGSLSHPYSISPEQMEAMLLSIKISKKHVLGKVVDSADIFNSYEARKYATFITEGLAKVSPDQAVNFSVVHKRPFFILRNDRISIANVFVANDGIHFQFSKIFAQLTGDYEASTNMDKQLRKAKTLRVSLEAQQGQTLSYNNPTEIILDPNHDFIRGVRAEQEQRALEEKESMLGKPKKSKGTSPQSSQSTYSGDTAERLRKLEELKKQKLVTEAEYQAARKKILSEL